MRQALVQYVGAAAVFLVLDLVWLGSVASGFYRRALGHLLLERFNLAAAAVFYPIFVVGIVVFAVAPGFSAGSWKRTLVLGALFGFFTYATYDLTNLATLRGWPIRVVIVDIAWGTFLCAAAALGGHAAAAALR